jgi:hypothetical protein
MEKENQAKGRSAQVNASLAAAAMAAMGFCNSAHATVLLQGVYGDGAFPKTGNPYFQYDYVELYNSGASSVSLNGLWLDMSGFATEPIAFGAKNEIPLPNTATMSAGGYYLIQINNGTSSPAFTGTAKYTAPTPDLTLVYSTGQANYSATYGSSSWTSGNIFSEPYFGAGKIGLVDGGVGGTAGGSNGAMLDYLGYGPGLSNGTIATSSFGTNTYWAGTTAGIPASGFMGSEYAGYNFLSAYYGTSPIPSNAGVLGSGQALVRIDDSDSFPSEDNNNDWAVEYSFSLTNSAGDTVNAPEPATLGLVAAGSILLMARRRNAKKA